MTVVCHPQNTFLPAAYYQLAPNQEVNRYKYLHNQHQKENFFRCKTSHVYHDISIAIRYQISKSVSIFGDFITEM